MVFSSHVFLFWFLPVAVAIYHLSPPRLRNLTLTIMSYVFYGWSHPYFIALMLFSTAIDYSCGLWLDRLGITPKGPAPGPARARVAVAISVISNLTLLGIFKYFNFGIESWNTLIAALGAGDLAIESTLRVVLPLGISFYTFQSMSYTIDVYRGVAAPIRNPIDFACYVSMFPQLVAGPIVRFHEISAQLLVRTHSLSKMASGVAFLSLGLGKKVLLANPCGMIADTAFEASALGPLDAWFGVIAYAFQIYFDFSGYSDMAIGLGLFFGFRLPVNFNRPYVAESMTDFWHRWHVSLSRWLRDYLYIPLGGNRRGPRRTYVNLLLVMILGGLWHGAAWTFVIWGGIHGVMLALERARGRASLYAFFPRPVRIGLTFAIVCITWVFFRSDSLPHAAGYLASMFGVGETSPTSQLVSAVLHQRLHWAVMICCALVVWGTRSSWAFVERMTFARALWCIVVLLLAVLVLTTQSYNPFIYFIF